MSVTIKDMMNNPAGKGSRQGAARYATIMHLQNELKTLVANKEKKKYFGLSVSGNNPYIVWVKTPSSSYDNLHYDTIFRITIPEKARTLLDADIQMYSNVPSWPFTYGYVAVQDGLIVPGWEKAIGLAATKAPSVTNPTETLGFDKQVTIALMYMLTYRIQTLGDLQYEPKTTPPDPKDIRLWCATKQQQYDLAKQKEMVRRKNEKLAALKQAREDELKGKKIEQSKQFASTNIKKSVNREVPIKRPVTKNVKMVRSTPQK